MALDEPAAKMGPIRRIIRPVPSAAPPARGAGTPHDELQAWFLAMNVQLQLIAPGDVDADLLAFGLLDGPTHAPVELRGTSAAAVVEDLIARGEFSGSLSDVTPLHGLRGFRARTVVLFGLGKESTYGPGAAFSAGVALARKVCGRQRGTVAVLLGPASARMDETRALVEGLIVGTRGPDLRKSHPDRRPPENLLIIPSAPDADATALARVVEQARIVGEAVNLARDLVNTPPAEKSPRVLAARAREVAIAHGLGVEVWDESRIREERFGGLLGVAAGSDEPPAFVTLDYQKGNDGPTLALVGKGVTFDSGGLSLKPSASMEDMKADMTGAAVVLATMSAIAQLNLPVNVRGYLALTENMTGGRAMKLGDVLTMRNGATVEVMNTDAEGRLILADALAYAAESEPTRILDLATLTGACIVALGLKVAGLFSNDDAFAQELLAATSRTGERAWRMPLDDDFKDGLKSPVADLKNVAGKWGGAITAAKFLQSFVGATPWLHLDIAGPSWHESEGGTRDAGGTGCFVRTLVRLLEAGQV